MNAIFDNQQAEEFLQRQTPVVILRAPGCTDYFVNPAHRRVFGEGKFKTVSSLQELRLLPELPKISSPPCYCDKREIEAAFALRSEHCAFESSFDKLVRSSLDSVTTMAFLRHSTTSGVRTYDLFRVKTNILTRHYQHAALLECEVTPLNQRIDVTSHIASREQQIRHLGITVRDSNGDLIWQNIYPVPRDRDYELFASLLADAIARLNEGESPERVLNSLMRLAREQIFAGSKGSYGPVEGHIGYRFSEPSRTTLIQNLQDDLTGLFDSLVLTSEVKQRLETEVSDQRSSQNRQLLIQSGQKSDVSKPASGIGLIDTSIETTTTQRGTTSSSSAVGVAGTEVAYPLNGGSKMNNGSVTDKNGHRPSCLVQYDEHRKQLDNILPSLLPIYEGKFVAFSGGVVIDNDQDESVLVKRVRQAHGNMFILISKITNPDEELVCIDTLGM